MLVARSDGSVSLYLTDKGTPIRRWEGFSEGRPIVKVLWSTSRPAVFLCLDSASKLYFFNMLMQDNNNAPWHIESLNDPDARITDICYPKPTVDGRGVVKSTLAVAFRSGHVQLHTLSSKFADAVKDERGQVRDIVKTWVDAS
mmetsp:Transcript_10937/g.21636  ORF Transcript_10937/g.21636 Transcript_10937/m.21636 type:complete len:143 (+) Transcript_10937:1-429(+)